MHRETEQTTNRDKQKDRRERGRQRERKCFHFLDNRLRKSKSYEQTKILELVTQIVSIRPKIKTIFSNLEYTKIMSH